jgi:hypothetical protein
MLKRFILWLQEMARPGLLLRLTLFYLSMVLLVMQPGAARIEALSEKSLRILDLQFGLSPALALEILADYSQASRDAAAAFLVWADTIYPLSYAALLALLLAFLFRGRKWAYLSLFPLLAALVDFCENFFLYQLLTEYPEAPHSILLGASICNTLKWSLIGVTGVAVIAGLIRRLIPKMLEQGD